MDKELTLKQKIRVVQDALLRGRGMAVPQYHTDDVSILFFGEIVKSYTEPKTMAHSYLHYEHPSGVFVDYGISVRFPRASYVDGTEEYSVRYLHIKNVDSMFHIPAGLKGNDFKENLARMTKEVLEYMESWKSVVDVKAQAHAKRLEKARARQKKKFKENEPQLRNDLVGGLVEIFQLRDSKTSKFSNNICPQDVMSVIKLVQEDDTLLLSLAKWARTKKSKVKVLDLKDVEEAFQLLKVSQIQNS